MLYGNLPKDLGPISLQPTEMMFWMYLPISLRGDHTFYIPPTLDQFIPIIREARWDDHERFVDSYVYLTAKTLWVEGSYIGNRPGWHSDGFGTEDVNYIWSDRAPTEFLQADPRPLSDDCAYSMIQMKDMADFPLRFNSKIVTFPDQHLLRLDPSVIHRSPVNFEPGMRTFVKVSMSQDRYDLIGNSINHALPDFMRPSAQRQPDRNHPSSKQYPKEYV